MQSRLYFGLVDLMFAYCYNHRTTEGENTVESAWTMVKLSTVLSCFVMMDHISKVKIASTERSLVYPWIRSYELSEKVWTDVMVLFKLGRRALLKALLEMKRWIERDEVCFSIGRVWLTDYCIWIQQLAS
jgi:protein SHQ1